MDFLHEGLALGVDLIFLGLCIKEYRNCKRTISTLKETPQLPIDSKLKDYVAQQENKRVPYAMLRGTVAPIGTPFRCVMTPSVTGVLQVIKLNEHRVARGIAGFWADQKKLIHMSTNHMPFELRNGGHAVEIIEPFSADILDMDVVYDNYEPTSLSFFDHVFGFFSGVRRRGLQTTEEVLRDGSFITAVGELELDGQSLRLQPTAHGPFLLTTATKSTLIKRFQSMKNSMLFKIVICSSIGAFLLGYIVRKFYLKRKAESESRKQRELLERTRRERRALARPADLTQDQLCVVCAVNPKEIIMLPCGHVSVCEDCSEQIAHYCPVCRSYIDRRAAAFIV